MTTAAASHAALYQPADMIRPGDILPDISRFPVATVARVGADIRVTFTGTSFIRVFPHGGADYGYAAARINRPA